MKVIKKPIVVEAFRFDDTFDNAPLEFRKAVLCKNAFTDNETYCINTLEGELEINKGDWIIKGIVGEFYAIKNDIFLKTYSKEKNRNKTTRR